MNIQELTELLGWSLVINSVVLFLSTLLLIGLRKFISRIHQGLFGVNEADLGRAYFQYLAQYKIAILVLNFAPYIGLKIMGL
jgi:hypothetical protein